MTRCFFLRWRSLLAVAVFALAGSAFAEWTETHFPAPASLQGPQWFRCYIRVPDNMAVPAEKDLWRDSIVLQLGGIPGDAVVFLNGQKIIEANGLADNSRRRFKVPKDILQKSVFNALVIRATGEVKLAPVLSGYFDDLSLDGAWQLSLTQPAPADFEPLKAEPQVAAYNEKGFHPASSVLTRTVTMPGARLSPAESLAKTTAGDGLTVDLVLSEPQVAQPTHISFDERGRMWVAQYRQYPYPAGLRMLSRDKYYRGKYDKVPPPPPHQDRGQDIITVHESTKQDGIYDKHTVVLDGLNMANAALKGHGGIWVMNTPYLMFYPDRNNDDIPDGDPEVRLAGFGLEDTHSVANGLAWGPDGWLYGAQGSTTTSRVRRPDVDPPDAPGVYFEGCMVWRYHPERKIYEIFAEGGGNTFGLQFDGEGRLYSGHNGGETRGWHYVPSGLYLKQGVDPGKFGPNGHPYNFGNLPQMKTSNPIARFSHMIIVAEGNTLPANMQGRIIGADPLHHNVVISERYRDGSTFSTSDSGFAMSSTDPAFRPVYLANGPDGALYVADFYEEYIAHGQNYQGQIDPTTGRIFRLHAKELPLGTGYDLSRRNSAELIGLLSHPNLWHRQTAVRLLSERKDESSAEALKQLIKGAETHPSLDALWVLFQTGRLDPATALVALAHSQGPVRAWAIRLMGERGELLPEQFTAILQAAATDKDAEVRCQIASTARRLPGAQAIPMIAALLRRDVDAADPFIPLLCWHTLEEHCEQERAAVLAIFAQPEAWNTAMAKKHILPRLMRRFATTGAHADLLTCARLLESAPTAEHRQILAGGFEEAFKGRALPALPAELVAALARTSNVSPLLRVRLGDPEAIREALAVVRDSKAKVDQRLLAVRLFGEVKAEGAVAALLAAAAESTANAEFRKAALVSLLLYDDPAIGEMVAKAYANLPEEIRPAAINLLASRAASSAALVGLIEEGVIRKEEVQGDIVARLQTHQDPALKQRVAALFGGAALPQTAINTAEIRRIENILATGAGDPYKGEPIFMQRCAVCHTLFFKGGAVGPNLTAYQREDLGTLLPSIVTPSAEIREGFESYLVTTKDGRSLSGLMTDKDAAVLVLRGVDGQNVSVPREQVATMQRFDRSLMPEGLLIGLSDQELRDFFAYLRIPQPITR